MAEPGGTTPRCRWEVDERAFGTLAVDAKLIPKDHECSICYAPVVVGDAYSLPCCKRGCPSVFHGGCIRPWIEREPTCPLCRGPVRELVRSAPERERHDSALFETALLGLLE